MNIWTRLIFLALAVYGLANAITVLKAGLPIRNFLERMALNSKKAWKKNFWLFWKALFSCPPCMSFWIGMAASYWVLPITNGLVMADAVVVMDGLILSTTSYFLHLAAEKIGYGLDI